MKRLLLIGLILMLSAGVAWSGPIWTKSITGEATTENYASFIAKRNQQPVLNFVSINSSVASGDVIFYGGDNSKTTLSAAEAAGQTAISLTSCGGLDDNDYLVFQDKDGDPIEATQMSACNDTTNVATVTALVGAYQSGANVYEMQALWTLSNVGTARLTWGPAPVLVGVKSYPLAVSFKGTGSIEVITVDHR